MNVLMFTLICQTGYFSVIIIPFIIISTSKNVVSTLKRVMNANKYFKLIPDNDVFCNISHNISLESKQNI